MGDTTRTRHPRRPAAADTPPGAGSPVERARIAAARIVAHDATPRTSEQRAAMLARTGLTRIVWDWREEHARGIAREMDALVARRIEVVGLWCPMPLDEPGAPDADARLGLVDPHVRDQVAAMRVRGWRPDLWTSVEFGQEGAPARLSARVQRARVRRTADHLEPLARFAADEGLRVALTNHLGWFGEPENQVEVIRELRERNHDNVGIAYQFQHGHSHAERFEEVLAAMQPYLLAVALSGIDADGIATGRKILPWGAGRRDRKLAHLLMASGWEGQIAVQGCSADDAEARLLDSLDGIAWMLDRWQGVRHARPVPRIATPAWPEPAGVPGPYLGMSLLSRRVRRRLIETGEMSPTVARVRLAPAPPPPVSLAPAAAPVPPRDSAEADAVTTGDAPGPAATRPTPAHRGGSNAAAAPEPERPGRRQRRARGGAYGALAAIHAARAEIGDAPPAAPEPPAATVASARPATPEPTSDPTPSHPLSPIQDAPASADAYRPADSEPEEPSGELPLRIARREVSAEAPDPYTGAIHALLTHLEAVGFRGAPRSFGWDAQGRHLVEWVDGVRADHRDAPAEALDAARIGAFMREMHDALETFEPPADAQWFDGLPGPGGDLIIHQDIAPSNVVVAADGRLVAIDWDAAAPGTRLWDVAHAVHAFAPLHGRGFEVRSQAERMRAFADGYGLADAERERLLPLLSLRSERMYHYLEQMRATGESPWLELWERGVGTVWASDAEWIRQHEPDWRTALLG